MLVASAHSDTQTSAHAGSTALQKCPVITTHSWYASPSHFATATRQMGGMPKIDPSIVPI